MGGSRKKSPCVSWVCCFSNKKDKRIANRIFRKLSKSRLLKGGDLPYRLREVSDTYSFSSDGLAHWVRDIDERYLRK